MNTLEFLSLDKTKINPVVTELQGLLADFQVYYANLRGLHWNIKGARFYQLHEYFEHLYDDAAEKIDEIAERILMLGSTPAHNFSEYLKVSAIQETGVISKDDEALKLVLGYFAHFIQKERAIVELASEANDEGTVALLSDLISAQEKAVWMLTSTLA